jgi:hypothetical protein
MGTELNSQAVDMPARSKQELDLAELFSLANGTTGYLRIDYPSDAALLGCIQFGEKSPCRFFSALPLQKAVNNRFLLGHIANGTMGPLTFFTGLAVVNPATDPKTVADVSITAYDHSGIQLARRQVYLGGDNPSTNTKRPRRIITLLHDLMPELNSLFGGYLIIENRTPMNGILVFELFGDMNATFLSAVPAIPIH